MNEPNPLEQELVASKTYAFDKIRSLEVQLAQATQTLQVLLQVSKCDDINALVEKLKSEEEDDNAVSE